MRRSSARSALPTPPGTRPSRSTSRPCSASGTAIRRSPRSSSSIPRTPAARSPSTTSTSTPIAGPDPAAGGPVAPGRRHPPFPVTDTPTSNEMRSEAAGDPPREQFWRQRQGPLPRRELLSELFAGAAFVVVAAALLLLPGATGGFDPALAAVLVGLYVVLARIEFPVGAGNMLPTQLVLVPMLVLLPPALVPPLVAAGLLLARLLDWVRGRGSFDRLLFSVPDAWHALGPVAVLLAAGVAKPD